MIVLILFFVWRALLFLLSFFAEQFFVFHKSFPYVEYYLIPSGFPQWVWSFGNFDGVHYLTIAETGYGLVEFVQVFFPLYPFLIRFLKPLFDGNYFASGLFIANACFLLVLFVFRRLLQKDMPTKNSNWVLLAMVVFPFSFFFGSIYTESIFLLLVLLSFYYAREKRWLLAGIFGALASATRITGIFLLPALLWEQYGETILANVKKVQAVGYKKSVLVKTTLYTVRDVCMTPTTYIVPLGMAGYMLYLQLKFADFLYFWHVQPIFGAERSGSQLILPPQVLWRYAKIFFTASPRQYNFWVALWEVLSFLFAFTLLVIAHKRKIRLSYLIFSWFALLIPSFTGTFSSMPRYILVIFPLYIILGTIKQKYIRIGLFLIQSVLLGIFVLLFTSGYWVA